jgi:hypothetical protein
MQKAQPSLSQLGGRLYLSPQRVRGDKACEGRRWFPREHGVHRAAQLVGEHGQGFGFAVFAFECGEIRFPRLALAEEEHGGFAELKGRVRASRGARQR